VWAAVRSHVILPKEIARSIPKGRVLSEGEWRGLGIQQSRGWEHYACHR
jgi:cyclin-dependent kinase regulatory subunit CKS1